MKTSDRFLAAIVAGILVLVAAAFAVVLLRPQPAYRPEDTPEAVAYNYLLAIRRGDSERAYGYLSPGLDGYPASAAEFAAVVEDYSWNFRLDEPSVSLEALPARITVDQATVRVRETRFYAGGLFDSSEQTDTFDIQLERDGPDAAWKITGADSYWAWCWDYVDGCR